MKRRRRDVIISLAVKQLISEQVLHIANDSIDEALAWEGRLQKAIRSLGDIVTFAIDEDATARLGFTVHKFVFERAYLVHYWIDEGSNAIRVIGFRHGSRLPRHRNEP